MTTPPSLGVAMNAIYASGARGADVVVLISLAHACDWDDLGGATTIDIDRIADRSGIARSTAIDALARLVSAGVVVVETRGFSQSKRRRIEWDALATYSSPKSSKGGKRVKREANHSTDDRSNEAAYPTDHRSSDDRPSVDSRPTIGHQTTDGRSLPSHYLPIDPPSDHQQAAAPTKPGKRKPAKPAAPSDADLAVWRECVAVWSEFRPDNAAILTPEKGDGAKLLAAIRNAKIGPDKVRGRLIQAVRGSYFFADLFRKDPGRSIASLLWVEGEKMLAEFDSRAEHDIAVSTTAPPTSAASAAWDDFAARAVRITSATPPNRPERFGDRFGVDLAADRPEHARRFGAFVEAGGLAAWTDATRRAAFRSAFLTALSKRTTGAAA